MLERIKKSLEKNGINAWRITEAHSATAEAYFIKKKLDIPRLKEIVQYQVVVYYDAEKDGKKLRGTSSTLLSPGMDDAEIDSRVKSAYFAASFALNPFYELPDPVAEEKKESTSDLAKHDLKDVVLDFAKAMFSVDTAEDAFLNSVEIFANKSYEHIVASNGLDVSFDADSVSGEYVAQCITPSDVEQFRQFEYDSYNIEGIKEKVKDALMDVRARARATASPKAGTYDILLKGDQITELMEFYLARSNASMIVPGYSQWKAGDSIQGENVQGEKISLKLVPVEPYSGEGIPLVERDLLKDGKLETIYGSNRFCRYLGIKPTGDYSKFSCSNGSRPIAEMRKEGVLEPVSFSDFQMDIMDGHFKGEIRLAFLHHADGSVEELTGGSINGALIDLQGSLTFSNERYEDMNYSGPLAVLIPGVAVAGK